MEPLPRAIPIIACNHIAETDLIAKTVHGLIGIDGLVVVQGLALLRGGTEGGVAVWRHLVVSGVRDVCDKVAVLMLKTHRELFVKALVHPA